MGNGPKATVAARPVSPPRYGLVPELGVVTDAGTRWEGGIVYVPEADGSAVRTVADPCDTADGDLTSSPEPAAVEWETYLLHAGVICSTFGSLSRDWPAQARRRLESVQSSQLERELWTGTKARAQGWPNLYLAHADVDNLSEAGSVAPTHALACLEQYAADVSPGQRAVIHATPQTVSHWNALGLVRREGALILTALDSIVVPGAGYDGSGPGANPGDAPVPAADGAVWAYVTSMVDVRLGEIETAAEEGSYRTSTNEREVLAQRFGLASWDGIVHGGIPLDLVLCDTGGAA